MQTSYFELWLGAWPSAIDWTAAVMNTHIAASLATLSKALDAGTGTAYVRDIENELNRYFGQSAAYYFGEDTFAIRNEAFDDMLWVVLAWLEHIRFMQIHSRLHLNKPWHGSQYIPAFAHRAHVFYDLASRGWDESLCGGGMVWNPVLEPYKNAITNQLWISASVGMYLHFPGDNNSFPFMNQDLDTKGLGHAEPHDTHFLEAAVQGYSWFKNSNMTNTQGLYVDGFHISGLKRNSTTCDDRNEMIYTYNQGVILSGLRGLWESTGNTTYLEDGHELVRNVMKATGWIVDRGAPTSTFEWAGLGRAGILEEMCDAKGDCSQDAQTFKGIYFQHLGQFCEPLPREPLYPGKTYSADKQLAALHDRSCQEYAPWIAHNARAAVGTRDAGGRYGGWWSASSGTFLSAELPHGATDYRNNASELLSWPWASASQMQGSAHASYKIVEQVFMPSQRGHDTAQQPLDAKANARAQRDWNDRGRGRTIETQSGGIAVLKTLWQLMNIA
ncbi:putative glycoside hydrolase, family 76, six-hairpin glycosidase superfamily [Septoria linicola]|nr:putative glycoside hydrolase, family 76, six-hairpin glycosidase superfamily [Septoria linicola]